MDMDFTAFLNSSWYTYLVIPVLIFLARILDVSIGTIRVIFITRGFKKLAPVLAFIEVLIWLAAVRQIFTNLSNPIMYLAYAAGFSIGTYVGIYIEEKISMGKATIRIITKKDATKMFEKLKKSRFTYTAMGADGPGGKVQLIIAVADRKDIPRILKIIKKINPDAFYSIEDVRFAYEDHIPKSKKKLSKVFRSYKKGK
jgi:uncharacterized protein YebE (UPF0316 family)